LGSDLLPSYPNRDFIMPKLDFAMASLYASAMSTVMGDKQRVLRLWWEGLPVSYIARHLELRVEEVRAIVGTDLNGGRR
jgi:hypothetical protein